MPKVYAIPDGLVRAKHVIEKLGFVFRSHVGNGFELYHQTIQTNRSGT